jgi:hypothetical protein
MRSILDSRCSFLGLVLVGWAGGCVDTEAGLTSQAEAGSVCAFVTGSAGGQTITTPSLAVIVADTAVATDPAKVHLDETEQSIAGYSLRTPGVDHEVAGRHLFVPGPTVGIRRSRGPSRSSTSTSSSAPQRA